MDLLDFTDMLFKPAEYKKLPDSIKKKYFFSLNRFLSNQYPGEVNRVGNVEGIPKEHKIVLCDWWQKFLMKRHGRKPQFFYIPTAPPAKEKTPISKFKKEILNGYMKITNTSENELNELVRYYPKELVFEIETYRKSLDFSRRKNPKKR